MAKRRSLAILMAAVLSPYKESRLRMGTLRARGVPAILLGVAAIVLATGVSKAVGRAATALPETLREARLFWLTVRGRQPELPTT